MTKTLREQLEEILPKETNHYYVEKLLSLFTQEMEKIIKESKPGVTHCYECGNESLDEYEAEQLKKVRGMR